MSVSWHWRHSGPHVVKWVVGLHHVGRLEAVPPSDHIQLVVYHRHAELQPPPVHDSHLDPSVGAQVVLLDCGGTWSHRSRKNIWEEQTQAGGQLLRVDIAPLVASIPPTAYSAPTVDFLGLVLGLWNMGRLSGRRWYFMASISSFWHSRSSENILLFSRSARSWEFRYDIMREHRLVWRISSVRPAAPRS